MDPVTFTVACSAAAVLTGGAALGLGLWRARSVRRSWRRIASELGLYLEERRWLEGWVLWGPYRGVLVQIDVLGKGKARLRALLSVPAPAGLLVLNVASWPGVAWRQFGNFQLEDESIDPSPRCRADEPALGQAWMRHPSVLATVRDLSTRRLFHSLSDSSLVGILDGGRGDLVRTLLDDLVDAVVRLEEGLECSPPAMVAGAEGAHESKGTAPDRQPNGPPDPPVAPELPQAILDDGAVEVAAVARLVLGLEAEGRIVGAGEFSLDRHTAREKLRRFQLVAPQEFLWPLLRAAFSRGARRVDIKLGGDLHLVFDGQAITREEAEGCWSALFVDSPSPKDRSLRLLGIGLNAALAGSVGEASLASGSGAEGVAWSIRAEGADSIGPRRHGEGGTEIRVARTGWSRADRARLAKELRTRLSFAPAGLDLRVEGERVATSGMRPAGARGIVTLCGRDAEGAVGFSGEHLDGGRVHVVMDGVLVESFDDPSLLPGLVAVVGAEDLVVDLSQRSVIRNHAWDRMRSAVSGSGVEALEALAEEVLPWGAAGPVDRTIESVLRACLGREWLFESDGLREVGQRISELPLFPTIDGSRVSLKEVREWLGVGEPLRYSGITLARACLDPRLVKDRVGDPARILYWGWPMRPAEGAALFNLGREVPIRVTRALLALPRDRVAVNARLDGEPWPGP